MTAKAALNLGKAKSFLDENSGRSRAADPLDMSKAKSFMARGGIPASPQTLLNTTRRSSTGRRRSSTGSRGSMLSGLSDSFRSLASLDESMEHTGSSRRRSSDTSRRRYVVRDPQRNRKIGSKPSEDDDGIFRR